MSWASMSYLLAAYWPYLTGVGLIGLVVGWRSFAPPKP
jgi:hypothetical protein